MSELEKNLELLKSITNKKIDKTAIEYETEGLHDGAITKIIIKIEGEFNLVITPNSHFNFPFLNVEKVEF